MKSYSVIPMHPVKAFKYEGTEDCHKQLVDYIENVLEEDVEDMIEVRDGKLYMENEYSPYGPVPVGNWVLLPEKEEGALADEEDFVRHFEVTHMTEEEFRRIWTQSVCHGYMVMD